MTTAALRRAFEIVNGGTPTSDPENWDGEVPWATPIDLSTGKPVLEETARTLTRPGVKTGSRSVSAGSLILSTRAPIGYVSIASREMAFNQGCRGLIPRAGQDPRFHRYQLIARAEDLVALGQGSTFAELSTDSLASVQVQTPEPEEQRRIADFLDDQVGRLDHAMALRQKQLSLLEEELTSWLFSLIDQDLAETSPTSLRRFTTGIEQGYSPQADSACAGTGEWGILKTSAIKRGQFFPYENKALPPGEGPQRRYGVNSGDVLVTRGSGSADLVADVAVARVDGLGYRLLLSDLVYRLRGVALVPDYLCAVLLSARVRGQIRALVRQGSGPAKVRGDDLLSLMVPTPAARRQRDVAVQVTDMRSLNEAGVTSIEESMRLLEERKRALITEAVTGEFDVGAASSRAGDAALAGM